MLPLVPSDILSYCVSTYPSLAGGFGGASLFFFVFFVALSASAHLGNVSLSDNSQLCNVFCHPGFEREREGELFCKVDKLRSS